MAEEGFEEIRTYVTRRQNMVTQYIAMWRIMDFCERSIRRPGAWVSRRRWDQEILDLEGAKEISATESYREDKQSEGEGLAKEETTS